MTQDANDTELNFLDEFDYGPEHTPKATNEAIAEIHRNIERAAKGEEYIAELTEKLASAKKLYTEITENIIPRLMKENGLTDITTPQGVRVQIDSKLYASIPAPSTINKEKDPERRSQMMERREAAIAWLESNGHEALIKRSFEIEFGRDEQEWAQKFKRDLAQRKKPLHVNEGLDINANSLSALVRELAKKGDTFPREILGVFPREVAKISAVRPK